MNITYFEKILYLYPDIQHVVYWHTKHDESPWEDPYDGIDWQNNIIPKPAKEILDALDEKIVEMETIRRQEAQRKMQRDLQAKNDLSLVAAYDLYKNKYPEATFSQYLDSLESLAATL